MVFWRKSKKHNLPTWSKAFQNQSLEESLIEQVKWDAKQAALGIAGHLKLRELILEQLPEYVFHEFVQFHRPYWHPSRGPRPKSFEEELRRSHWEPTNFDIDFVLYGPTGLWILDAKNATKDWDIDPMKQRNWMNAQAHYIKDVHLEKINFYEPILWQRENMAPRDLPPGYIPSLNPNMCIVHLGVEQSYKYVGDKLYRGAVTTIDDDGVRRVNGQEVDKYAIPIATPEELIEMLLNKPKIMTEFMSHEFYNEGLEKFKFLDPMLPKLYDANGRVFSVNSPSRIKKHSRDIDKEI